MKKAATKTTAKPTVKKAVKKTSVKSAVKMYADGGKKKPVKAPVLKGTGHTGSSSAKREKVVESGMHGITAKPAKKPVIKSTSKAPAKFTNPYKPTADSTAYYKGEKEYYQQAFKNLSNEGLNVQKASEKTMKARENMERQAKKGKPGYDSNGFPILQYKKGGTKKSISKATVKKYANGGLQSKPGPGDDEYARNISGVMKADRERDSLIGIKKGTMSQGYMPGLEYFDKKTKKVKTVVSPQATDADMARYKKEMGEYYKSTTPAKKPTAKKYANGGIKKSATKKTKK